MPRLESVLRASLERVKHAVHQFASLADLRDKNGVADVCAAHALPMVEKLLRLDQHLVIEQNHGRPVDGLRVDVRELLSRLWRILLVLQAECCTAGASNSDENCRQAADKFSKDQLDQATLLLNAILAKGDPKVRLSEGTDLADLRAVVDADPFVRAHYLEMLREADPKAPGTNGVTRRRDRERRRLAARDALERHVLGTPLKHFGHLPGSTEGIYDLTVKPDDASQTRRRNIVAGDTWG